MTGEKAEFQADEDFETEEALDAALYGAPGEDPETEKDAEEPGEAAAVDENLEGAEKEAATDENLVPQSRFDEVHRAKKEAEEKLELFRTNPDSYYQKYPDEQPADYGKPNADDFESGLPAPSAPSSLTIRGGMYHGLDLTEHDGKTLGELYKEDPALAADVQFFYRQDIAAEQQAADNQRVETERQQTQYLEKSRTDMTNFTANLVNGGMTAEDAEAKMNETIQWMTDTGRGGGNLEDAHYLMNRTTDLRSAKAQGAAALVDHTTRAGVRTVSNGGGDGGDPTGYERFEQMTVEQMGEAIEAMDDAKAMKFFAEAPESVRKIAPYLPWEES